MHYRNQLGSEEDQACGLVFVTISKQLVQMHIIGMRTGMNCSSVITPNLFTVGG